MPALRAEASIPSSRRAGRAGRERARRLLPAALVLVAISCTSTRSSGCDTPYVPAAADYDFTASVDRWGQATEESFARAEQKRSGTIHVNRLPIFDPENEAADHRLYRWVNRVHRSTRERVIRRLLLFDEGDRLAPELLAESERILRDQKYLGDAEIRVVDDCGDRLDLEVVTKEVWTMVPEISLHLSGGDASTRIGLRDSNFLGTGKKVSLIAKRTIDRDSWSFHYTDVDFLRNHKLLRLHLTTSSDGYDRSVQVGSPFRGLDSRRAWGAEVAQEERVDHQYVEGEKINGVLVREQREEAGLGFSRGLRDEVATRYRVGFTRHRIEFGEAPGEMLPAAVPPDLDLLYPYLEFERIEDRYTEAFNLDQMYHVEDLYLGTRSRSRLGYSPGADAAWILEGEVETTLDARKKQLLQASVAYGGRWSVPEHRVEAGAIDLSLRYHRGQTATRSLFAALQVGVAGNPDPGHELALGGESGLRGYPNRYQNGDMRYLLSVEERIFTDHHLFHLAHVGYAVFFDVGRAWTRGGDEATLDGDPAQTGTLSDIGFGLRIVPSKSTKGEVIHVNLAIPLSGRSRVDGYQISAQLKKRI